MCRRPSHLPREDHGVGGEALRRIRHQRHRLVAQLSLVVSGLEEQVPWPMFVLTGAGPVQPLQGTPHLFWQRGGIRAFPEPRMRPRKLPSHRLRPDNGPQSRQAPLEDPRDRVPPGLRPLGTPRGGQGLCNELQSHAPIRVHGRATRGGEGVSSGSADCLSLRGLRWSPNGGRGPSAAATSPRVGMGRSLPTASTRLPPADHSPGAAGTPPTNPGGGSGPLSTPPPHRRA